MPTSPDTNLIANYEQRLRDLMSAKDKAANEALKATQDRLRLQQEKDLLAQQHQALMSASQQTLQEALDKVRAHEQSEQAAKARATKAEKLLEYPELAAYRALIPDTDDVAKLDQAIATVKAAREADIQAALAAVQANQAPQAPAANPASVLPSNLIPPAAPARPAPAQSGASVNEAIEAKLKAAAAEALQKGDKSIFDRAAQEAALMAQAAQQQ
jgi:type II secretory pathway component HofQ